ncbi:hypothetical protein KL905_001200 [Ogataea polymorpha]|uniref:Uncharacterized protein n=2 Tax=Ogataea polymorpha TaxID=460523 RepID=A0A9P8PEG3_9ASCO|nr:hypothetical protein KL937_004447 [Ogataea polymorpha]KAG7913436.1 hypothetical protein KL907_000381 [Ogataea polymorpha]KAG7920244.1 hypothetical protein KL927_000924 [Ogataea polymorpha]KAG7922934.1 hypothetical protein KL905_001200 [Ogataea polymorpha]KAG7937589.1 hypothetical protein KL904_001736 [Ogataea polymorpha]
MVEFEVPNSPVREDETISWELVEQLLAAASPDRQITVQDRINEISGRKTRRHGFCQRHVYTADLAEYLSLASRTDLERISRNGVSDGRIFYMLNRKYIKLRHFYERHQVAKHRFKKKDFNVYLEDFKRYQATRGRGGKAYYEAIEDRLSSKADRRYLLRLQRMELEQVSTDESEDSVEEINPGVNESISLISDEEEPATRGEPPSAAQNTTADAGNSQVSIDLSSPPTTPVSVRSISLEPRPLPNATPGPTNSSNVSPESPQQLRTGTQQMLEEYSIPELDFSRRTRRHKFSQDHVYVTDTAVYLGLSSIYQLNDLYEQGKSYQDIMTYLESVYSEKRKEREKKEIGYGPFYKPSFAAYLASETHKLAEQNNLTKEVDMSDSSEDEYVEDEPPIPSSPVFASRVHSQNDDFSEMKAARYDEINEPGQENQEDAFIFSNRILKRKNSMEGVAPKSFSKLNKSQAIGRLQRERRAPRPGLARKRNHKHARNDEFADFLTNEDFQTEIRPFKYEKTEEGHTPLESAPTVESADEMNVLSSASSDSDVTELFEVMINKDYAEEDRSAGINYMLNRAQNTKGETKSKPRRPRIGTYRQRRSETPSVRYGRRVFQRTSESLSKRPMDQMIWISDDEDKIYADDPSKRPENYTPTTNHKRRKRVPFIGNPGDPKHFYYQRRRIVGTAQLEDIAKEEVMEVRQPLQNKTNTYADVLDRLGKKTSQRALYMGDLSLDKYQDFDPGKSSFINSKLFHACLNEDGDYYKHEPIEFTFGNLHYSLDKFNTEKTPRLTEALLKQLFTSLAKQAFSEDDRNCIRKAYIRILQLIWNMIKWSRHDFMKLAKVLLASCWTFLDLTAEAKIKILFAPFHLTLATLTGRLIRQLKEDHQGFDHVIVKLQRQISKLACSISKTHFYCALKDNSSKFSESMSMFLALCPNPWKNVASLAKEHELPFENVVSYLYFLHSQRPVLVDWEFFIHEIEALKDDNDIQRYRTVLSTIMKVIRELNWNFEELLLVKIYRLISYHRFENIGSMKRVTCHVPLSLTISESDGCLDMYIRFLTLHVQQYMEPEKRMSLIEKVTPVSDISTCTVKLLGNRICLLMVMTRLFKHDFSKQVANLFGVLIAFGSTSAYEHTLDLVSSYTQCQFEVFQKVPLSLLRGCLAHIIDSINTMRLTSDVSLEKLRYLAKQLWDAAIDDREDGQLGHYLLLFTTLLKIRTSHLSAVIQRTMDATRKLIWMKPTAFHNLSPKIRTELLSALKSIVMAPELLNDSLKKSSIHLWVHISSVTGVVVDALIQLEWQYFGTAAMRSKYELAFFTSVITFYRDHQTSASSFSEMFTVFLQKLADTCTKDLFDFCKLLAQQNEHSGYLEFRTGKNLSDMTMEEFSGQIMRVSIRILARLVVGAKKGKEQDADYLKLFVKSLSDVYKRSIVQGKFEKPKEDFVTLVRYLNTVASSVLQTVPEFIDLRHELAIEDVQAPLNERFESTDSMTDLMILLESEYINSLINYRLELFQDDVVADVDELPILEVNPLHKSVFYSLLIIVSLHLHEIPTDKSHWIHLQNWLEIILLAVKKRRSFSQADVWTLVRLITLCSEMGAYKTMNQNSWRQCSDILYQLLNHLSVAFLGYEDMTDFRRLFTILDSLNEPKDHSRYAFGVPESLLMEFNGLFTEYSNLMVTRLQGRSMAIMDCDLEGSRALAERSCGIYGSDLPATACNYFDGIAFI